MSRDGIPLQRGNKTKDPGFAIQLLRWHTTFGRKTLPWQQEITPYRVWLSEIMLQQTQVATVIPYFQRFVTLFPTIQHLASANLDEVLHLWTGLGYYARARNLHLCAKIICSKFNQEFPETITDLMSLPGIGRSTAGAILSIAFQKKAPILDGNVRRVLTRYYAIEGDTSNKTIENKLWDLADQNTPVDQCAVYTQAIMDLGATVCTRSNPSCLQCPFHQTCMAYNENRTRDFPTSRQKKSIPVKSTSFIVFSNQSDEIFLQKRPLTGIWGGLWSFPECKEEELEDYCKNNNLKIISQRKGSTFRHTFSHFHLDIRPIFVSVQIIGIQLGDNTSCWCLPSQLPAIGIAAPIKKILESLLIISNN